MSRATQQIRMKKEETRKIYRTFTFTLLFLVLGEIIALDFTGPKAKPFIIGAIMAFLLLEIFLSKSKYTAGVMKKEDKAFNTELQFQLIFGAEVFIGFLVIMKSYLAITQAISFFDAALDVSVILFLAIGSFVIIPGSRARRKASMVQKQESQTKNARVDAKNTQADAKKTQVDAKKAQVDGKNTQAESKKTQIDYKLIFILLGFVMMDNWIRSVDSNNSVLEMYKAGQVNLLKTQLSALLYLVWVIIAEYVKNRKVK